MSQAEPNDESSDERPLPFEPPRGLTAAWIAELATELERVTRGLVLVDVAALPPRDLLLVLADGWDEDGMPDGGPLGIRRLRLSASPDAPRAHLQHGSALRHKGPEGPFYRRVRAELLEPGGGTHLASITQPRGERILRFVFRGTPSGAPFSLLLELFGRQANLLLLDRGDRVLSILSTPSGKSAERLQLGEPWEPPPSGKPRDDSGRQAPPLPADFHDHLQPPPERRTPLGAPVSWVVESLFGGAAEGLRSDRRRKEVLRRLERRLARARAHLKSLDKRRKAAAGAERVRMDGDLVKAALGQIEKGSDHVVVEDWFEGGQRRIDLDPARSPKQNLDRIFARYKKLQRGLAGMDEEEERTQRTLAGLEELTARAADEDLDSDGLDELEAEAVERGLLDAPQAAPGAKANKPPERRLPYRIFHGSTGAEIRVGRSARDNDELTTRHCRGKDLWLHTADSPGSHVVLCLAGAKDPEHEDLLDAAHLALHFSPQKGSRKADIHVARGKEVHKPRGAKPGLVTLSGGKTMHLRFDEARLERLMRRDAPG
ncbi:MAG: NFACT RNA binding domain-containing protein [Planctomycetota bacterium]|nr:NFACT RNA binding domain-containing protein [Planctomycetota bacterium]